MSIYRAYQETTLFPYEHRSRIITVKAQDIVLVQYKTKILVKKGGEMEYRDVFVLRLPDSHLTYTAFPCRFFKADYAAEGEYGTHGEMGHRDEHQEQQEVRGWVCPACTFNVTNHPSVCTMCDRPRYPSQNDENKWTCSKCNEMNENCYLCCMACGEEDKNLIPPEELDSWYYINPNTRDDILAGIDRDELLEEVIGGTIQEFGFTIRDREGQEYTVVDSDVIKANYGARFPGWYLDRLKQQDIDNSADAAPLDPDEKFRCTICYEDLDKRHKRALVPCGHSGFCKSCVDQMDQMDMKCPVCRYPFVTCIYVIPS